MNEREQTTEKPFKVEKPFTVERNSTVERTSTVGRTSMTTYPREGYLSRRYRGEHIRSVRYRKGYLLR